MNILIAIFLLVLGPRIVLFGAWIFSDWYMAFESGLLGFIGWVFLPWTSLAWMYIYFNNDGQLTGGYLILFIAAILVDMSSSGTCTYTRED